MDLPKFICIGAQKSGTTWLYEMLAQNPSIWLPPIKEVHYFDGRLGDASHKEKRRAKLARMADAARKREKNKGSPGTGKDSFLASLAGEDILSEAWYRRIFSHPDARGRVSGEITPAYLALDEQDIDYAKTLLGDAKILLLVREPVARALSQLRMMVTRSGETPETEKDWSRLIATVVKQGRGDYATAIPRWQARFGPDQMLILPFGDLKKDPGGLIRRIETFIGAKPYGQYQSLEESVHQTKTVHVPDFVKAEVEKRFQPQRDFLATHFGEDFLAWTS